jgi:hypothetical protein
MTGGTLTQSELLSLWERGDGQSPSRRALALLAGAAPEADAEELTAMPVGRRDAALLALRERLFGSAFTGVTSCPACGEEIELSFDADEVRCGTWGGSSDPPSPERGRVGEPALRFSVGEYEVEVRLPTTADLFAIERMTSIDEARARLFERCVVNPVGELPPEVVDAVIERMAALDPRADMQLDADCPSCAHRWREPFDIVTFLFTELSVFARRLLADVHTLARGYGWSEREILDLSPARRNAYLEMLR